jgi:excisionase family DNA binding protein
MNDDDIQPLTLTVEQAAKLLGIGRSTAYELVHTGDIPSLRLGRRIVVPEMHLANRLGTNIAGLRSAMTESATDDGRCQHMEPLPASSWASGGVSERE